MWADCVTATITAGPSTPRETASRAARRRRRREYALSFSSGLAAIDVLLRATLKPDDNILLGNDVYGGTYRLLAKVFVPWGIGLDVVDITDTARRRRPRLKPSNTGTSGWRRPPTRCSTSPTSPRPPDARIGTAPRSWWTTRSLPRCCSIRSTTVRRGRVFDHQVHRRAFRCGRRRDRAQRRRNPRRGRVPAERRRRGAIPVRLVLDIRGLKTLAVRVQRHSENALKIAQWLETRPEVERVWYPGLESHPGHEIAPVRCTAASAA